MLNFTKSYTLFLCVALFLCLLACKEEAKTNKLTSPENKQSQISGKVKIIWPDSLTVYNPFNLVLNADNRVLSKSRFKVYVYLNLACSSCLDELNEWSKLATGFKEKNIELITICYAKDNFEYFKYLYESKEIKELPFPFYLEHNFGFSRLNTEFKRFQVGQIALTDEADTVLLFGDILNSKQLYNSFLNIINK